jgi:hypothetical protein
MFGTTTIGGISKTCKLEIALLARKKRLQHEVEATLDACGKGMIQASSLKIFNWICEISMHRFFLGNKFHDTTNFLGFIIRRG